MTSSSTNNKAFPIYACLHPASILVLAQVFHKLKLGQKFAACITSRALWFTISLWFSNNFTDSPIEELPTKPCSSPLRNFTNLHPPLIFLNSFTSTLSLTCSAPPLPCNSHNPLPVYCGLTGLLSLPVSETRFPKTSNMVILSLSHFKSGLKSHYFIISVTELLWYVMFFIS